jgi:hypothetical protein
MNYYLPKNLKIEMSLSCESNYISIKMDFSDYSLSNIFSERSISEFIVKGRDSKWVNQTVEMIEKEIQNHRTRNDIIHSSVKILTHIDLMIIIGLIIYYFIVSDLPIFLSLVIIIYFASWLGWHKLMKTIFPKYSTKL